ncbi:CaiB/BaiF CoA transferase family protein [Novosphingobium pokkalii]|uniref:CaiB/BaiF CoA transferase family protein n=1 Tax=Novosphingobium pokkalii TaxID=1770194 RepID=A0ABV7VA14_9SPHN|nr:CaiB/BaiF CoA-transferase family protein [Novosphingobium pokkalii]GHD01292.1 CoA transferase [Novosphingobium pokkalii]
MGSLNDSAVRPLAGIKVLDLGIIASAPFAARTLQDLGADVIKLETPDGDPLRGGPDAKGRRRFPFLACNRGRRSIAADLKTPGGQEILHRLVRRADVLIENFRPGVGERLGVTWDKMAALNPTLIHCTITGFPENSPLARLPITDGVIQAHAGVLEMSGRGGNFGEPLPIIVADAIAGSTAAQGITAALFARVRTGTGVHVEINMLDGLLNYLHLTANITTSLGPPATNVLETGDGQVLLVQPVLHFFSKFAAAVDALAGCPELVEDTRYATPEARAENVVALRTLLQAAFRKASAAQWLAAMAKAGVPAGPINTVAEGIRSPEARAIPVDLDGVEMMLPESPFVLDGMRNRITNSAPEVGEHTDEILLDVGFDQDEIAALRAGGSIAASGAGEC